jgi:tRNA A-37 threonylcarbamoyl transferase component Bud32
MSRSPHDASNSNQPHLADRQPALKLKSASARADAADRRAAGLPQLELRSAGNRNADVEGANPQPAGAEGGRLKLRSEEAASDPANHNGCTADDGAVGARISLPRVAASTSPELAPEAKRTFPFVQPSAGHHPSDSGVRPAPAAATPSQGGTAGSKPSSGTLRLRKKQEAVIEGGRDVPLQRVERPECCNCQVTFAVDEELPPLTRIDCPRCGARQVVPALIDHFILERELGRGGMGVTYRAFDTSLQRNVAVKLISERRANDRSQIAGMITEARRAATLSHPHIVPIYSIGSVEGMPYIVMELLSDNRFLRPVLKKTHLGEAFALETGRDIARALAEAAAHGLLHLDVKPANILHDRFGVAKLIDFGLACDLNDRGTYGMGTCLYMAPERLRHQGQDFRSDQYSLGLTLWHALAARAPYAAPDQEALAAAILRDAPPILNQIRPDLLDWTAGLIHKMIAYEPEDRYQDYDQLIRAFDMVLEALKTRSQP